MLALMPSSGRVCSSLSSFATLLMTAALSAEPACVRALPQVLTAPEPVTNPAPCRRLALANTACKHPYGHRQNLLTIREPPVLRAACCRMPPTIVRSLRHPDHSYRNRSKSNLEMGWCLAFCSQN